MPRTKLSLSEARRTALAAQGFDRRRPARPDTRHIRRVIETLGLLQLDFVNVLVPAHYLVVYSRLGPYSRRRLDALVGERREFIEHWAHEASIVPVRSWPLLAHRRAAFRPYANSQIMLLPRRRQYLEAALQIVRDRGPVTAADLPPMTGSARKPGEWYRSVARSALEYHFGYGNVAVPGRLPNFQRQYDLPERVIDEPWYSTTCDRETAERDLLRKAASACGVATVGDLADYWRMSPQRARPRVLELAEEGALTEVAVEGWTEPAYLSSSARIPRRVNARALLSPFDPVVWYRPRVERLFGFHYRLEIYVPPGKRKWGYYVLPFLMGERIAARVDLKADRKAGKLTVLAAHAEEGIDTAQCAAELLRELRAVAAWLDLAEVAVARKGSLAPVLARAASDGAGRPNR